MLIKSRPMRARELKLASDMEMRNGKNRAPCGRVS